MKMKKIVLFGAVAMVVLGCVFAAGCASTQPTDADPMAGKWICSGVDIGNGIIVDMFSEFNADGSGTCFLINDDALYAEETVAWKNLGDGSYLFDITVPGQGTYTVTYTLSSDKTTMSDDSGRIWNKVPEVLPLEKSDRIVGTWHKTSIKEGEKVDNVFIFHSTGDGYWMKIADTPSLSFTRMRHQDVGRIGKNTYVGVCSAGRFYILEYQPETDGLLLDGKSAFSRVDPIVGIWSGDSKKGGSVVTTIMKTDGTGVTTTAYENGTAQIYRLTWKKNDGGTYDIAFSDGDAAVYTLESGNRSLTSSSGLTKTKQFMDSYFLLPITGAWYSKDTNAVVLINGDKTGSMILDGNLSTFTWDYQWKETDLIDFTATCTSGTAEDGTSLTGKTFAWTYDLAADTLVSSLGTKFTHPAETVEGLITLN